MGLFIVSHQPKQYLYKDSEFSSAIIRDTVIAVIFTAVGAGVINANAENKVTTMTVNWEWEYETGSDEDEILTNDKIDTQNAQDITNYTFDVVVTGTQVMPNA